MKHTLSVLVENKAGALARIATMFARRGFNIDSLAVGPTEQHDVSRITLRVDCEKHALDQIEKQIHKLVNVLRVTELVAGESLERELALIKVAAQWLGTGLILAVMTPVVMIVLGAPARLALNGLIAALLGSLSFALIGGVGAALALGARKGGALMALLVLPFYVPPVIFGAALMTAGPAHMQALAFLGAYALFALALGPVAMGAALRHGIS